MLSEIQGIVLHGYGSRPCARFGVFQVKAPERARAWLFELAKRIQYSEFLATGADEAPYLADPCLNVAFTHAGLAALGLTTQALFGFSDAFREGMTQVKRAHQLGDDGPSHPSLWRYGGLNNPEMHGVLLVYGGRGDGDADEDAACKRTLESELCMKNGIELLHALDTRPMLEKHERKEHFGFRDGISNPKPHSLAKAKHHDRMPDGELVLGYPNAFGTYGQTPEVEREHDPRSLLPASRNGEGRRDFGKNGSYLVLRTLAQNVPAFWRTMNEKARTLPDGKDAVWLASRMVGRWPNGTPLTLHPDAEGPRSEADANDFLFVQHGDELGERCPIGSHVRRTNPRDTMLPVPHDVALSHDAHDDEAREKRLESTRRRRLMRRGRAYGSPLDESFDPAKMREDDGNERGLHFLCLQASLRRQFEFVQSMWVMSPTFAGLSRDPDPLLGADREYPFRAHDFTIQGMPPRCVRGLDRFVETRGGAYLFVPSRSALLYLGSLKAPSAPKTESGDVEANEALRALHTQKIERDFEAQREPRRARRAFHDKSHGIVRATLVVDSDLPSTFVAGVFQPGRSYPAWVRFSSGSFLPKPDSERDVHGLAIKLVGVPNEPRAAGFEQRTQDFVLIDAPRLFVPDAKSALAFDRAFQKGTLALLAHFALHPRIVEALFGIMSTPRHPLARAYSSVAPFAHGPGRIVRYAVRLAPGQTLVDVEPGPDHLRRALVAQLSRGRVALELCIQVRGSRGYDLDDGTLVWDTREERVATLTLHPDGFGTREQEALGEAMSFNPWNALEAHRPLGNLNEARRIVYRAVYELRRRLNRESPFEPKED